MMLSMFIFVILQWRIYARTRITCIGDSITEGAGASEKEETRWTAVLQKMLGNEEYDVNNFGNSGKTLTDTRSAYRLTSQWEDASESEPDVVIIGLGTNDAKDDFWYDYSRDVYVDQYQVFVEDLEDSFDDDPPEEWYILVPIPNLKSSSKWSDPAVINTELPEKVTQAARRVDATLVDLQPAFYDEDDEVDPDLYNDSIHPNDAGHYTIAATIYTALTGNPPPPTARPTRSPTPQPTYQPTYSPTYSPTHRPTPRPTHSPTYNPTYSPTRSPTPKPTTPSPTPRPSDPPTFSPSLRPIPAPTQKPSSPPSTDKPTSRPTPSRAQPTRNPAFTPTSIDATTPIPAALPSTPTSTPTTASPSPTTSPSSSPVSMAPSAADLLETPPPSFVAIESPAPSLADQQEPTAGGPMTIVEVSSALILDDVDAEAFNADPEAAEAIATSVAEVVEVSDGFVSGVSDVVATSQRRRRRLQQQQRQESSKISFFVRAVTFSSDLDDFREDFVSELSSSFADGTFDESLSESDSLALANATVAVDESTTLVEEETAVATVPQRTDSPTPSPTAPTSGSPPSSKNKGNKNGGDTTLVLLVVLCGILFLCVCVLIYVVVKLRPCSHPRIDERRSVTEDEVRRYLEEYGTPLELQEKGKPVEATPHSVAATPLKEARIKTVSSPRGGCLMEEGKHDFGEPGAERSSRSVSFHDTPLSSDYVGVSSADTPPDQEDASSDEGDFDETKEDPRRARKRLHSLGGL